MLGSLMLLLRGDAATKLRTGVLRVLGSCSPPG
jgi:hypothetical protein